jgi:hypothetical protein
VTASSTVDLVRHGQFQHFVAQTANNEPKHNLPDAIERCIADMLEQLVFAEYSNDDKVQQAPRRLLWTWFDTTILTFCRSNGQQ